VKTRPDARPDRPPVVELPGPRQALADLCRVIARPLQSQSPADTGLFGPGSVTWRIHRDPAYGIGGIASLFHQALHPVAMAAVDQHSDFSYNAWVRTWRTTEWVFTVVFGSTGAAETAGARVRRLHERITGTDPVTGRDYRAEDPDLLLWVHAVGIEYTLRSYEIYAHELTAADADRFVREAKASGRLVGLEDELMPSSVAELRTYLARMSNQIRMTEPAGAFFRAFLRARMPFSMRAMWLLHLVGMLALLPADVRKLYGSPRWIPSGPVTRTVIRLTLRLMNVIYPIFKPVRDARRQLDALERGTSL
jgi:uncharacterized protein (DUF2236 family)